MNKPPVIPKKIKEIEIRTRILVEEMISGIYHSAFKGRGIEFSDVREYSYGDDIRSIDWNVTARLNKPYIKTFKEERELSIIIAVDASYSTVFGTGRTMRELMTEVAALFCFSAIKNNDRVGEVIFSDRIERYLPPKSGNVNVLKIMKDILSYENRGGLTNIKNAMSFINRLKIKKSVVIFMSDFLDSGYEKELKIISRKHDFIPIVFSDPFYEYMQNQDAPIIINDIETKTPVILNSSIVDDLKRSYLERFQVFSELGINYISLTTRQSPLLSIIKFFQKRSKLY